VLNIQTAGTTAISIDASQAVSFTNAPTVTGGTANGVAYLNGSKVLTTGSALVFDGSQLSVLRSSTSTTLFDDAEIRAINTGAATINQRVDIAMRFQASQALEQMTGKRYGGDIDAWRGYLAGQDVPEPKATLAESIESLFLRR
jgi:hypothetical protein